MKSAAAVRLAAYGLVLVLVAVFAGAAWHDYERSLQTAETELLDEAALMEERTEALLLAGFLQLNRVNDLLAGRDAGTLRGSHADQQRLREIVSQMPGADSFWIVDARGQLALSSRVPAVSSLDLSDREYFTAVRDGAETFISPLIWGRLYGGYYVAISRRLTDAQGRFAGVAQLSLRADQLNGLYRTLNKAEDRLFTLARLDGGVVARHPLPEREPERTALAGSTLLSMVAEASSGSFRKNSVVDGTDRVFAYRRLPDHPLVVVTGMSTTGIITAWASRTAFMGAIGLPAVLALLLAASRLSRSLEREVKDHERLRRLVADKDTLFQEIHHRVKNNLQIVSSFLTMQSLRCGDERTEVAFRDALDRIHTMGLVHQLLYERNEASQVEMDDYFSILAERTATAHDAASRGIAVVVESEPVRLSLDRAVPLALIANEALTNAFKHAFAAGRGGTIAIRLARRDDEYVFVVADDGVGMAGPGRKGVGMTVVGALARQLEGRHAFGPGPGTTLEVVFPV